MVVRRIERVNIKSGGVVWARVWEYAGVIGGSIREVCVEQGVEFKHGVRRIERVNIKSGGVVGARVLEYAGVIGGSRGVCVEQGVEF